MGALRKNAVMRTAGARRIASDGIDAQEVCRSPLNRHFCRPLLHQFHERQFALHQRRP